MTTHLLKCWSTNFRDVKSGRKPFEIRINDRDFEVGDVLQLAEWNRSTERFTGEVIPRTVTSMVQGRFGLPPDVAVLGFAAYAQPSTVMCFDPERIAGAHAKRGWL